jgi:hypothetical protein
VSVTVPEDYRASADGAYPFLIVDALFTIPRENLPEIEPGEPFPIEIP